MLKGMTYMLGGNFQEQKQLLVTDGYAGIHYLPTGDPRFSTSSLNPVQLKEYKISSLRYLLLLYAYS